MSPGLLRVFSVDTNTCSWGAILRDEVGKTLLTAWGRIDHFPTAEVAEAVAGIQSIKVILPVCDRRVHIKNDCVVVIGALKVQMQDKSAISGLICEMKDLLSFFTPYQVL
jgi:hypothetical protein